MTRKFAVILAGDDRTYHDRVGAYLRSRSAWWHWSPGVWLIKLNAPSNSTRLRDEISKFAPGVDFVVLEINSTLWAGLGPDEWKTWFTTIWESPE